MQSIVAINDSLDLARWQIILQQHGRQILF